MPTEKIAELPWCTHPDHDPDKTYLDTGIYQHTCPRCGKVENFTVTETYKKWERRRRAAEPWPDIIPYFPEPERYPWPPAVPYHHIVPPPRPEILCEQR